MKRFKLVVPSFVALIFCALLMLGSTLALFTSQDQASIAVTSGKVKVTATMNLDKTFSAKAVSDSEYESSTSKAGQILTGDFAGNYVYDQQDNFAFVNGGGAALANNEIVITKMTPGDKVEAHLDLENKSNVNIKYRLRINALEKDDATDSLDLLEELVVMVGTRKISVVNTVDDWTNLLAGNDFVDLDIVIYLPLESGNDYQGLTTGLLFTLEAVQGNAATDNTLEAINVVLNGSDGKNATMYDAFQELATANYDFATVSKYVWNSKTDLFYNENTVLGFENQYFKVYKAMPETQTFSIYADSNWNTAEINNLTVGFDAGNATGITSINYDRHEATKARESVIRTNSLNTNLTINAPLDSVLHYGDAGTVNVIAVAGNSLHVNGNVNLISVKKGHVKLESTSDVLGIYVYNDSTATQKDTSFEPIKITVATENVPTLSRSAVKIADEGTKVCTIVTEEAKDVYLFNEGIYEQIKTVEEGKSLNDESVSWADDDSKNNSKTQTAALQLANEVTRTAQGSVADKAVEIEDKEYTVVFDIETRTFETYESSVKVEDEAINSAAIEEAIKETGITETQAQNANTFRGKGTQEDPYLIANCDALINVDANKPIEGKLYYKVVEDLNFAALDQEIENNESWAHGFLYKDSTMYSIDLNGHTITVGDYYVFGYACNLELFNGKINYVGRSALVDYASHQDMSGYNMNFHDLVLSGSIETGNAHYGPLVCYAFGLNSGSSSFVADNIVNNMRITNSNSTGYTGGLFGYIQGSAVSASVTNCTFNGTMVSAHAGAFVNTCSAPKLGVTSSGNTVNGQLVGSKDAYAFGCNGNVTGGSATLKALQDSVTLGENASLTVVPASTDLIAIDENNQVILSRVEGAETYRVAVVFMVNNTVDHTGGYPRYITVDLDQFTAETKETGIYKIAIAQENEDLSEGEQIVLNGNGCKIWLDNGTYHVYIPDYELSNNKATIWAYAYNNGDIVAYQSIDYTYQVEAQ